MEEIRLVIDPGTIFGFCEGCIFQKTHPIHGCSKPEDYPSCVIPAKGSRAVRSGIYMYAKDIKETV
jgi:hypothetical protein